LRDPTVPRNHAQTAVEKMQRLAGVAWARMRAGGAWRKGANCSGAEVV